MLHQVRTPPHSSLNSCPLGSWDKIQNHWLRDDQSISETNAKKTIYYTKHKKFSL